MSWTKQDFVGFAKENLLRSDNSGEQKLFRMVNGGLPWGDILGTGARASCFATGITTDLCIPLQCAPRGEADEKEGKGEEKKAEVAERNAVIRQAVADRKERGELSLALRRIVHELDKTPVDRLDNEMALAVLASHMTALAKLTKDSAQLNKLCRDRLALSFWDWAQDGYSSGAQQTRKAGEYVRQLHTSAQRLLAELNADEDDGTFTVFPSLPKGRAEVKKVEEGKAQLNHQYPPVIRPVPFFVSQVAADIAVQGDRELGVQPLASRGFGSALCRDLMDDWRIMQIRDADGQLHMVTDVLPLLPFTTGSKDNCLKRFQEGLSQIMFGRPDKFTPNLVGDIVPNILASLAGVILKDNKIDYSLYDLMPSLYYTTLEVIMEADKKTNGQIFQHMYQNVMLFVSSRPRYGRTIGSLQAFLCRMALCGVPWARVREPFMREFLIRAIRNNPMRENATAIDYKRHLEAQCMQQLRTFLFLLSFDGGQGSLTTKLEMYRRNRGRLPNDKQQTVTAAMQPIAGVTTLEEVFLLMGLVPIDTPPIDLNMAVLRIIRWAMSKQEKPYEHNGEEVKIAPEKMEKIMGLDVSETPIAQFWQTRRARLEGKMDELKQSHSGGLVVTKYENKRLPEKTCAHCGATFESKQALFRKHLDTVLGGKLNSSKHPLFGHHASHYSLKEPYATTTTGRKLEAKDDKETVTVWICNAAHCGKRFDSEYELNCHQRDYGVPGDWSKLDEEAKKLNEAKQQAEAQKREEAKAARDPDLDECIVCFDANVTAMFLPCGHQHFCAPCATAINGRQGTCPYCRATITEVVQVHGL